ncbi:TPA: hypothetical protein ACF2DE_002963 [Clostridium perfringens]
MKFVKSEQLEEIKNAILKQMEENRELYSYTSLDEVDIENIAEEFSISFVNVEKIYNKIKENKFNQKAKVILNEQHTLLPSQKVILDSEFGINGWDVLSVPSNGWSLSEQLEVVESLKGTIEKQSKIVFASPLPIIIGKLSRWNEYEDIYIFHNDKREKKELPNGKIIFTVAQDGWQLVEI